jgi:hypothetical protein
LEFHQGLDFGPCLTKGIAALVASSIADVSALPRLSSLSLSSEQKPVSVGFIQGIR